jgi:hypothetical protein
LHHRPFRRKSSATSDLGAAGSSRRARGLAESPFRGNPRRSPDRVTDRLPAA